MWLSDTISREVRRKLTVVSHSYLLPSESDLGGLMGFHVPPKTTDQRNEDEDTIKSLLPSLWVILDWSNFFPVKGDSRGFDTILISAIPSNPTNFSKSTYPASFLLTLSTERPKYVPLEFDFRMLPHQGLGGSEVVTWRKTDFVEDSRIVYAYSSYQKISFDERDAGETYMLRDTHRRREHPTRKRPTVKRDLKIKTLLCRLELQNNGIPSSSISSIHPKTSTLTYLRYDQILRKLRKPNNMIKQLRPLPKEIRPSNKLQRHSHPKRPLIPILLLETFTQDLIWIRMQFTISRPRTVPDVRINQVPCPTIIRRVISLNMTLLPIPFAAFTSTPQEILRIQRMEMEYL